jgi:general secretion pathway protein G
MKRMPPRRKSGFTLIEVLLVLVILVILASLATYNILNAQKAAKLNAAKSQIDMFNTAFDAYQLDIGTFPSQASSFQALRTRPADIPDPDKWQGPYLTKDIPLDPWNKQFVYVCPGIHNPDRFDVYTTTPDGKEIGNWTEVK